jgi:CIC family chloride channel protein
MILRPDRLRGFAERSRDVVIASALVGVVTGLLVAGAEVLTTELLDRVRDLPLWLEFVGPGVGLVLAALTLRYLAFRLAPGLADGWLQKFHDPEHDLDVRTGPGGVLASMLTIGFGGAMGLEGLAIFAGGTVGTFVQERLRWLFRPVDNKVLMTAGAAAGVAAIFKAPATGALFAIEVPFANDFAHRKLLPCLVAAASGYLAFAAVNGTEPLFSVHHHGGFDAVSIVGALALGVVCGLGGRAFAWMMQMAKRIASTVALPTRIAVATITSGALFLTVHALTGRDMMLGPGYDCIAWATRPDRAIWLLLLVMLLRSLGTGVTTAGGGAGGLFIPLVVAGALIGRAAGEVVGRAEDSMFLIVGVAAFLGAGYRVPLAAVMFVAETTGRATFVVPALLAAVVADLVMGDKCVTAYQLPRPPAS